MDFFKKRRKNQESSNTNQQQQQQIVTQDNQPKSKDIKEAKYFNHRTNLHFSLKFISTLTDEEIIQKDVLPYLLEEWFEKVEDLNKILPVADFHLSTDLSQIEQKLYNGYVLLRTEHERDSKFAFISAQKQITRTVSAPEIEFSVIGPKEAFIESIDQNINLIRKRLPIEDLILEEYKVGVLSKTKVVLLYINGTANNENVETIRQRLKSIDFDAVSDSSFIEQIISDNHSSPFPSFLDTERPDRAAGVLSQGKAVIIVDGSPHALIGPTTLVEFFVSFEDYYINWVMATFFRLLRIFAVLFSILVTPLYVAALTYHYHLIPTNLMATLISSRQGVPFPPILEALVLELTIELLREAGARLPTKIGQTIGIVGGIVIGTASVDAGFTSNVLLILIALAALASFTTPVYKIGNTIRILRFPFLLFAQLWGLLGIVFCFCILLTHLIRLTSLGRPYLEPLYPLRFPDLKDTIVRLGFNKQILRPLYLQTKDTVRFPPKDGKRKKDIDE
ncbi:MULTISPECIES: spore germination protein [Heyndrickxia]|uniref:spore germination protein n=1 Tax=Heyndrickxia TaxID=2837504 RepID=UPI0006EC087C|nr:spore germination protein [Heyndrickxia shackletonii]NEZ00654.1 spore germination protein [Heyndrickxia shackletonii]